MYVFVIHFILFYSFFLKIVLVNGSFTQHVKMHFKNGQWNSLLFIEFFLFISDSLVLTLERRTSRNIIGHFVFKYGIHSNFSKFSVPIFPHVECNSSNFFTYYQETVYALVSDHLTGTNFDIFWLTNVKIFWQTLSFAFLNLKYCPSILLPEEKTLKKIIRFNICP